MRHGIKDVKEESILNNLLKNVWAKRFGFVIIGMILAIILFKPFSNAKVVNLLATENNNLTQEYDTLDEEYNALTNNYNTLLENTAGWRELTEEQQKLILVKVEEDKNKAEAEARAKEEAERKAEEDKIKQEEAKALKEKQEAEALAAQPITGAKIKEIVEFHYLGENEKLKSFSFTNGEIKATVELVSDGISSSDDIAVNMYSGLSDELLNYRGWEVLTIIHPSVGAISMHRNEKETNEYGDYFPTIKIEERLN